MAHLSTSHGIYLVSFNGTTQQFIFNSENEVFGNLIAEHGRYGIVFVKRFYTDKSVFKKMSKDEVSNCWSWDTHTIEQLKKINYIKK